MRKKKELSMLEQQELLKDYYKYSLKELEVKYKMTTPLLYREFTKAGGIRIHKNKKYEVNDLYFEKIDTSNKAYFLGLLFADGNINKKGRVHINLQESDKEVLEKLRIDCNYTGSLNKYKRNPPRKNQYALSIISHKMVKDLLNLGLSYNKTYNLSIPEDKIPKDLMIHFVRGFFDGDGCISIPKSKNHGVIFSIICLKTVAIQLNNFFTLLGIKSGIYKPKTGKYSFDDMRYVNITNKKHIFTIMSMFYIDSNIFIKRKYDKYKEAFIDRQLHLYEKYTSNTYTGLEGRGFLVSKLDNNGNIIEKYPSIKSAARHNKISPSLIRKFENIYKIEYENN